MFVPIRLRVLGAAPHFGIPGTRTTYPASGIGDGRALLVEALITFVLVLVLVAVATDERTFILVFEGTAVALPTRFALLGRCSWPVI